MRMLKNKNTGVVWAYTALLAERIGVDMIEVEVAEAKKVVEEIAEEAETRKDNKKASLKQAVVNSKKKKK